MNFPPNRNYKLKWLVKRASRLSRALFYAVEGLTVLINKILSNANVLIFPATGRSFRLRGQLILRRQHGSNNKLGTILACRWANNDRVCICINGMRLQNNNVVRKMYVQSATYALFTSMCEVDEVHVFPWFLSFVRQFYVFYQMKSISDQTIYYLMNNKSLGGKLTTN